MEKTKTRLLKLLIAFLFCAQIFFPFNVLASNWGTNYQNQQRNAVIPDANNPTLELKSQKATSMDSFEKPVYDDGLFYISEKGRTSGFVISAVSRISSQTLWSFFRTTGKLGASPLVDGDHLIISASTLICLNKKTGALIWETPNLINDYSFSHSVVIGNYIYIWDLIYGSSMVLKYDRANGQRDSLFRLDFGSSGVQPITVVGEDLVLAYSNSSNISFVYRYTQMGVQVWNYGRAGNLYGPSVYYDNKLFISSVIVGLTILDSENGTVLVERIFGSRATPPVVLNGQAYFLGTSQYETGSGGDSYINDYNIANKTTTKNAEFNDFLTDAKTTLIAVGPYLYFANEKGKIFKYSMENSSVLQFDIVPGVNLQTMIYADGVFVVLDAMSKNIYFTADINYTVTANSEVKVNSPYKCTDCNQYLGQLHSHYIPDLALWNKLWNEEPSPAFTVNEYKKLGYDFVALTEHNLVVAMPVAEGIMQIQNAEENTQGIGNHHLLAIGVSEHTDKTLSDQERINNIVSQGGIPIFAHPDSWVYGALTKTIANLTGLRYLEVYNRSVGAIPVLGIQGYAFDDYDSLLNYYRKSQYYLTAGDDYTPGDGFIDGGAVVVNARSNTQTDIMASLKSGDFYAVQGSKAPRLTISNTSSSLTVNSSEQSEIKFIGKGGKTLDKVGDALSATYQFVGDEVYVRAEVKSNQTKKASWTQPVQISTPQSATVTAGNHIINLKDVLIISNSSGSVTANTLDSSEYPDEFPPTGYLSPVYSLTTTGVLSEGNSLTINYGDKKLSLNENGISIYCFNESTGKWEKVPTVLDKNNKSATTQLTHYSMYALSAESPVDLESPVMGGITPSDLTNITTDTNVLANVTDNEAVTSVVFGIDDKYLSTDSDPSDGWSTEIRVAEVISGNHKLNITANDFSGNKTNASYDFTVVSSILSPIINIISPVAGSIVNKQISVEGNYQSSLKVDNVGIYIDGVFVEKAEIDSTKSSFSKNIDLVGMKTGNHIIKTVLIDIYGNMTELEVAINISEEVTANVVSPEAKSYLRSNKVPLSVLVNPENASDIIITLDGVVVGNNSSLDLINLSLGTHTILVKQQEKILASREFSVTTSYSDTANIVWRLYKDGHIKNFGTATAIAVQLAIAELFDRYGRESLKQKILRNLEDFIGSLSKQKKPAIDNYASEIILEHIKELALQ